MESLSGDAFRVCRSSQAAVYNFILMMPSGTALVSPLRSSGLPNGPSHPGPAGPSENCMLGNKVVVVYCWTAFSFKLMFLLRNYLMVLLNSCLGLLK